MLFGGTRKGKLMLFGGAKEEILMLFGWGKLIQRLQEYQ